MAARKKLSTAQAEELLEKLERRFSKNMARHKDVHWKDVRTRLEMNETKLWSLNEMEKTGGEPDVVCYNSDTKEFIFYDCAPESPIGRRSVCYDRGGMNKRAEHKPINNAIEMAAEMGIEMLNEEEYKALQLLGNVDKKTSSWVKTPDEIRILGGAIFCDCRYNHVFTYHNSAKSYYGVRGFRGALRV